MVATNEKTLMEQGDMYKSKLVSPFICPSIWFSNWLHDYIHVNPQVIEYDKFDRMEKAYNEMKEMSQKKTEELEKSIEQRVEKIQQEFDK